MSKIQSRKPVEIKISTVVAVSVILHEIELPLLSQAMDEMTGGAADYFDDEFAVIDVGAIDLSGKLVDWPALVVLLKSYRLNPVAVRNAAPELAPEIIAAGLSLDVLAPAPRTAEPDVTPPPVEPVATAAPAAVTVPAAPPAAHTLIIDTPVRAGQRVYARGADLVVTAIVNAGAELIADGSIHVYAPLRGRALAGASGNTAARIFALNMEAELVSIAGIYSTFENGFAANVFHHPVQVRLEGDKIELVPVNPN
ncbi:septum site-determining protein MinC [Noviherbaspirillum sedimenti]|uniref:Probable septum site-determining protein MinC n=1 Tax=Noviherbaspirillum sedimenti TaxID=2320865 RepID=A0A3A3G780_9BURK|nr:septum site-determining protein MinC [Noviherbaspirillum sedimenti]RJG03684.1 septum site-determining protein MinC [Noviherbaspirillum sedimenti]